MTFKEAKEMFKNIPIEKRRFIVKSMIADEIADLEAQDEDYRDMIETLEWEHDRMTGASAYHILEIVNEYGFIVDNLAKELEGWDE